MGHATQNVASSSCDKGTEGGRHSQQTIMYRAAPSRGRGVLIIPDNPEAVLTAIKPALMLKCNFENRFRPLIDLSNPYQTPLGLSRGFMLNRNIPATKRSRFRRAGGSKSKGSHPQLFRNPIVMIVHTPFDRREIVACKVEYLYL